MSQAPAPSPITIERRDSAIVVRLAVKILDDKELKELRRLLDEASQGAPASTVVIDLSKVQLVPSLTLGALVQLSNKCRSRQQPLRLAGASPMVRQVFVITRLDRVIELVESVDVALGGPRA